MREDSIYLKDSTQDFISTLETHIAYNDFLVVFMIYLAFFSSLQRDIVLLAQKVLPPKKPMKII